MHYLGNKVFDIIDARCDHEDIFSPYVVKWLTSPFYQTFSDAFVSAVSESSLTNADSFPHLKCENPDVIDDNWEPKKVNSAVDSLKIFQGAPFSI